MAGSSKSKKVTPLMKQYFKVKSQHPDAILLFRVGDFYETFGEDAVETSKVLGIVLTSRNNGGSDIELAGFPYHALDMYLPRLVKAGYRVAICEQLEKPSKEKKIVKRGITEIVTPGLATNDKLLDHRSNNFLASVYFGKGERIGIALLDISTGEFLVSEGDAPHVDKLLQSLLPSEVILPKGSARHFFQQFGDKLYTYPLEDWVFTEDYTREKLLEHFEVKSLKGFGVEGMEWAQVAAGAVLHYLASTENNKVSHINAINRLQPERYVWLDRFTIRNLELLYSPQDGGVPLIQVLDQTVSPMGARLMKKWVVLPLKQEQEIHNRHNMVECLLYNRELAEQLEQQIRQIGDLERLISKVPMLKINPREVRQLQKALSLIEPVRELLNGSEEEGLIRLAEKLNPCPKLRESLEQSIVDDPPVNLAKGGVMADGLSPELDELRHVMEHGKEMLLEIQKREAEKTGITNLKIGFNNVFGYYLEVTNKYKNQGLIPDNWVRKQTLTNSERYISEELKELETRILGAEEKMLVLETELFEQLIFTISDYIQPIQLNSAQLAILDCLMAFGKVALHNRYQRPEINDSLLIDIKAGRHPVIEKQLPLGEEFVPNDVFLDNESQQILMITGPNMSGKSALLRQTALICLMAQMGSFVPAEKAVIGLVDKVFTRVGASDNISSGESTFMVEMNETASIMNNISPRSLILLDEIGRGTSTYDGISIAWSIAEFLHNNPLAHPKTLFATHYHELNELANKFERIRNFHVSTREVDQKVIFLRKLTPGGSEHSFGIHVAKMAGMPKTVVDRANDIMHQLEKKSIEAREEGSAEVADKLKALPDAPIQLSIFETADPRIGKIKEMLNDLDLNSMTPIDCMIQLAEMKKLMESDE
jgi:DNA mismatch repair protein MutS